MSSLTIPKLLLTILLVSALLAVQSCTGMHDERFFGRTVPPKENVLRYITGPEPETFDPAMVTSQADARIMIALYEGLVDYHPKTMQPIPALAKTWNINKDGTVYTFHLRENGKFSNGEPIKASDVVYSIRRGLAPELASRNAYLAYYIKYAEGFNSNNCFLRHADGIFVASDKGAYDERLTVPCDEKKRDNLVKKQAALGDLLANTELVPVTAQDIGVEAPDDLTVRITLAQPTPFFLGLLAHQFFRVVHQPTVEKYGKKWTEEGNVITSGAFTLAEHSPYDQIVVRKSPEYWDAANVKLQGIDFYSVEEQTTILNLYKAGEVDAVFNHSVPAPWNSTIREFKSEYSLHPEAANVYYSLSYKKPPMDNAGAPIIWTIYFPRTLLFKPK